MAVVDVSISKKALGQLRGMPKNIIQKLAVWVDGVGNQGLMAMRKVSGFNDEALKGKRFGQRSIRLNKAYRAIYVVKNGDPMIVEIVEVSKHKY